MGTLLKLLLFGVAGIIALSIVLTIAKLAIGLAFLALPVVLVGWVVMKIVGPKKEKLPAISDADRKWLES